MQQFQRLVEVVKKLRDPNGGCPWDLKQTHETLLKYLIEESYEFVHATEQADYPHMEEEMGDVLLQILLHTTIAAETNKFTLESVSERLADKLIFRHPHVFKTADASVDAAWVENNWEKMKLLEKQEAEKNAEPKSRIDDSYLHMPALMSAAKIGKKTGQLKFDWDNAGQVAGKVQEEWEELQAELKQDQSLAANQKKSYEEIGDLLFSVAQLARHLGHDPEAALRDANKKFLRRFQAMERLMTKAGVELEGMDQKQMDFYWDQVKVEERKARGK